MMDELPTQADKSQKLIELWFFRECNQGTRSHLFALFGYPVEQVRNHSTERIVLRKILAAHRIASPTEAADTIEQLLEALREIAGTGSPDFLSHSQKIAQAAIAKAVQS